MEVFGLILICVTMFLGSYAAGCLPLFFTLSEGRIRWTSVFGAGLLVGTALCVIIPEGISTLYERNNHSSDNVPNASLNVGAVKNWELSLNRIRATLNNAVKENDDLRKDLDELILATGALSKHDADNASAHKIVRRDASAQNGTVEVRAKRIAVEDHSHDDDERSFGGSIGLALTVGFLFMFVVDQFSKSQAAGRNKGVPTLGLVIHAAADGIAMGSASTARESDMPMIVFFAIMIHKAPAAFALASFLLLEGLEKFRVRKHLMVFSMAAPLGTIFTYLFLRNIEADPSSSYGNYGTGMILLFSGGTFLYIAASHILPELAESKCSTPAPLSGAGARAHFSPGEIALFVLSAILPSILSSHHH